jgi:hypothetical protein
LLLRARTSRLSGKNAESATGSRELFAALAFKSLHDRGVFAFSVHKLNESLGVLNPPSMTELYTVRLRAPHYHQVASLRNDEHRRALDQSADDGAVSAISDYDRSLLHHSRMRRALDEHTICRRIQLAVKGWF